MFSALPVSIGRCGRSRRSRWKHNDVSQFFILYGVYVSKGHGRYWAGFGDYKKRIFTTVKKPIF